MKTQAEALCRHLRDGEKLAKKTTHRGLVAYRVVKG